MYGAAPGSSRRPLRAEAGNLPAADLLLQPAVALDRLALAEIFQLEDLPDLHFTFRERHPLRPLDHFFLRLRLDEPEAGDQLFGLREWAVDHRTLRAVVAHARSFRAGVQSFACQ